MQYMFVRTTVNIDDWGDMFITVHVQLVTRGNIVRVGDTFVVHVRQDLQGKHHWSLTEGAQLCVYKSGVVVIWQSKGTPTIIRT